VLFESGASWLQCWGQEVAFFQHPAANFRQSAKNVNFANKFPKVKISNPKFCILKKLYFWKKNSDNTEIFWHTKN